MAVVEQGARANQFRAGVAPVSSGAPLGAVEVATIVLVAEPDLTVTFREMEPARDGRWQVQPAPNAATAMTLLGSLPNVDALVVQSGVGGSLEEMLEQARRRSPHTARIVLADPADRELALRVDGLIHQHLPRPVDLEQLAELIEHIRSASSVHLRDPIKTLVGQIDRLPTPPTMFQRLTSMLDDPDWSIVALAREISEDVGLTGEMLKLVNSSFYGLSEHVASTERAIALLGIDMTRFVVLSNGVFQRSAGFETWIDLDRLANRSQRVALMARVLAHRDGQSLDAVASAYLVGIVSEIGLLVMARLPDIPPSIAAPVNVSTYLGAERAVFGGDRFEVGAHLLSTWGFDEAVIDAVQRQSSGGPIETTGLDWYLAAARHLVIDLSMDPAELVVDRTVDEVVQQALRAFAASMNDDVAV